MMTNPMFANNTNALISLLLMYSANLLNILSSNETSLSGQPQFFVMENNSQSNIEDYLNEGKDDYSPNYFYSKKNNPSYFKSNFVKLGKEKYVPNYDSSYYEKEMEEEIEEEGNEEEGNEEEKNKEEKQTNTPSNYYINYGPNYPLNWKSKNEEMDSEKEEDSQFQKPIDLEEKYYSEYWNSKNKEPSYLKQKNFMTEQQMEKKKKFISKHSPNKYSEMMYNENDSNNTSNKLVNGYKIKEKNYLNSNSLEFSPNISTYIQPILHFPPIPLKTYSSPQPFSDINQNLSDPTIHVYLDPNSAMIKNTKNLSQENFFQNFNQPLINTNDKEDETNDYLTKNKNSFDYDHIQKFSNLQINNEFDKNSIMSENSLTNVYTKEMVTFDWYKRFCYYLLNSEDKSNLNPKQIDPFLCTHIIIGYLIIDKSGQVNFEHPDKDTEKLRKVLSLKKLNKDLKILVSLKLTINGDKLLTIFESHEIYEKLIKSILEIIEIYNLDGIDLWLDFDETKVKQSEMNLMLKEIPIEIIKDLKGNQNEHQFLITISVNSLLNVFSQVCEIGELAKVIDFVNLLPFNFNLNNHPLLYTQHHNKLFPNPNDKDYFANLNIAWVTDFWNEHGMPLEKIMIGVATYGTTFKLLFKNQTKIGSPAFGIGLENGQMNYTQICRFVNSNSNQEFEQDSLVPFAYKNDDWIGYENEKSVSMKSRFVTIKKLGGIVTYALNFDDWKGECRKDSKTFPLQKAINAILTTKSFFSV